MVGIWKEGDVVQLKSGGPRMIVDRVMHYSDDSASVYCVSLPSGQRPRRIVPASSALEAIFSARLARAPVPPRQIATPRDREIVWRDRRAIIIAEHKRV